MTNGIGRGAHQRFVHPRGRNRLGLEIAVTRDARRDRNDIFVFDRQTGATTPFLTTEFDEDHPAFSPDGRMIAYAANDTGRSEVTRMANAYGTEPDDRNRRHEIGFLRPSGV